MKNAAVVPPLASLVFVLPWSARSLHSLAVGLLVGDHFALRSQQNYR